MEFLFRLVGSDFAYSTNVSVSAITNSPPPRRYAPAMAAPQGPASGPTPLTDWPLRQPTLLCDVTHSDPATRRRLAELGLRRGTRLTVLHRTAGGGRVVAAGELRLALDRRMATALRVIADDPAPASPATSGP